MRGQKVFKLLRADERGQVGKGDWKKSGKAVREIKWGEVGERETGR